MSELEKIADHDERSRKDAHAYYVASISGCPIVCYRPGLALVDFYRLNHVLASAEPKKMMSGSARMNSEVTGKSERDRQMEESPPATVNPSTQPKDTCSKNTP